MTPEPDIIPGSNEWAKSLADAISKGAEEQLSEIALQAAKTNGGEQLELTPADTTRLALILNQVQHQSFLLGVQMGVEMMIETLKKTGDK